MIPRHFVLYYSIFFISVQTHAQSRLEYKLVLEDANAHYLRVNLTVPSQDSFTDFSLPAWAPGSYVIENYAKYVQEFAATNELGAPLKFHKRDKQTWRVTVPPKTKQVTISYRIFANVLSDTKSEFNDEHAQVFGPQVFMYPVGGHTRPVRLRVERRRDWRIATGLTALDDSTFLAPNYDEFIDAPLEIGEFQEARFDTLGARFRLAVHGEEETRRTEQFADKLKRIVAEQLRMMGGAPFKEYVFIWHVDPRADYFGLEHLNSTSIGMPHRLGDRSSVEDWELYFGLTREDIDLEYAAHEFFHLWNVKRFRPIELGPFDYTREAYTTGLWIAEGITDYYGYLTLVRCGLWSPRKWLRLYSNLIGRYRRASGWRFRSASQNSFDTWLWAYGEGDQGNLEHTFFSYYPSGNLIGLCMDLRIRQESEGRHNLDEVMVALLERFGYPKPGFTEAQFWQTVGEVSGMEWDDFRMRYVDGTEELPLDHILAFAGIMVDTLSNPLMPYLGISVKAEGESTVIARVELDSGARKAGLEISDRLLAIDDEAVTLENWQELLHRRDPGDSLSLLIVRQGRVRKLSAKLGHQPASEFALSLTDETPPEAAKLRASWWRSEEGGR